MPITLCVAGSESVCGICSSCWPWQAQAAATVAPTHQDILNLWIPIPVSIGFFKLTKATTLHSIVMSETAAPFANPYNSVREGEPLYPEMFPDASAESVTALDPVASAIHIPH